MEPMMALGSATYGSRETHRRRECQGCRRTLHAIARRLNRRIAALCPRSADSSASSFECFVEAGAAHHTPHFHAYYQEHVGVFSIDAVELMAGELPRVQRRFVEACGAPPRRVGS